MLEVRISNEAQRDFLVLPLGIQARVQEVFARLTKWPAVSGTKSLKHDLKGAQRIRTGDWRVLFTVDERARRITVFRIANRRDVYE